jgi:uncharacterized surface anchored protein
MRGFGGSATPNARVRNIASTNNSTGVITALNGSGPASAKPRSAMASNGGNVGAYDPVMGKACYTQEQTFKTLSLWMSQTLGQT